MGSRKCFSPFPYFSLLLSCYFKNKSLLKLSPCTKQKLATINFSKKARMVTYDVPSHERAKQPSPRQAKGNRCSVPNSWGIVNKTTGNPE
jgi:hypothetical protein